MVNGTVKKKTGQAGPGWVDRLNFHITNEFHNNQYINAILDFISITKTNKL